jgi:hypothetical protein
MPRGRPAPEREGLRYPLFRTNDRPLPADYAGPVYVWDIDNTYLITEWSSIRDLIRIRFEAAGDKRPIPGAVPLLRALRRGVDETIRSPIYFVSASPETMRTTLERRMLLDGVEQDGATFRDLWTAAGRPHLRHIKDVYGYKVAALFLYRLENPPSAREVLFGDDREHDPEVYVLYSRVCAGQIRGSALETILGYRGVRKPDARYIRLLADSFPARDPVERIIIRRVPRNIATTGSVGNDEPSPFDARDHRILEVDDYAQAAAALRALGRIGAEGLARVTSDVRAEGGGADPEPALAAVASVAARGALDRVREELALLEPGRPARPARAAAPETAPAPGPEVVAEMLAEARALEAEAEGGNGS